MNKKDLSKDCYLYLERHRPKLWPEDIPEHVYGLQADAQYKELHMYISSSFDMVDIRLIDDILSKVLRHNNNE